MGEVAVKLEAKELAQPANSHLQAIVGLVFLFGFLLLAWAITFPPIFYHLFTN